jgi:alanine dehydrogenase
MTADIPRTASRALTHAHIGYLERIAGLGVEEALRATPALAKGTPMYRGAATDETIGALFDIEYRAMASLLSGSEGRG